MDISSIGNKNVHSHLQTPSPKRELRIPRLVKNESPITPATQTLNTLSSMGREDDWHGLLYDASQLSFHSSHRCEASQDVNKKPPIKKNPKGKVKVGDKYIEYIGKCSDSQYSIYRVVLRGEGNFGMEIHKTAKGNAVKRMNRKMQAYQSGIKIDDIICCPLEPSHIKNSAINSPKFCIDDSKLKLASLEELEGWSKSSVRPIQFVIKRLDSVVGEQSSKHLPFHGKGSEGINIRKNKPHTNESRILDAIRNSSFSGENDIAANEDKTVLSKRKMVSKCDPKQKKKELNQSDLTLNRNEVYDTFHSLNSGPPQKVARKVHEVDEVLDGPTWVLCSNPWGNFVGSRSLMETDFVLSCALDYQKARIIKHSKADDRFIMNPFQSQSSPYYKSHVSPNEGHSVIQLVRDRLCLRSWGLSFCRHKHGGACLVTGIEVMSPVAAAVHLGVGTEQQTSPSRVQINDMILCVNGKRVGGMTMLDLEIELNTCGNELILILSKCKYNELKSGSEKCLNWNKVELHPSSNERSEQRNRDKNLADVDSTITYDMEKNNRSANKLCGSIFNEESSNRCSKHESRDGKLTGHKNCNQDIDKSSEYCKEIVKENDDVSDTGQEKINEVQSESSNEAGDSWLGCVCGVTHKSPIPVFWIQCDYCDLWYNSSPVCLGFDEEEAKQKSTWKCPSCVLCDDSENNEHEMGKDEIDTNWKCKNCNLVNPNQRSRCKACYSWRNDKKKKCEINPLAKKSILPVGTVVDIAKRTWPRMNSLGGVARITDYKLSNDTTDVLYSVRYILENKREFDIEAEYVSLYCD